MIGLLALAWSAVVVMPFVAYAKRTAASEHLRVLSPERSSRIPARFALLVARVGEFPALRTVGLVLRAPLRLRRARSASDEMARQVAVAVDLVGVGVGAGHTPYLAVELAARWSPPLVAVELDAVMHGCSMGRAFDDALRDLGRRNESARGLAETLRTSARLGSPAAPALARLAAELRTDLRRRAEARARTVPVRLCFPLVGCILPAFALLTVLPAVFAGITR